MEGSALVNSSSDVELVVKVANRAIFSRAFFGRGISEKHYLSTTLFPLIGCGDAVKRCIFAIDNFRKTPNSWPLIGVRDCRYESTPLDCTEQSQ